MTQAEEAPVLFEMIGDHIALITLNRPAARNAINAPMAQLIEKYTTRVETDRAIRVAIVAAAGTAFCAGADLKEVAAGRGAELSTPHGGFGGFVLAQKNKAWIAAVQGAAHGGGTEIALTCDLVVAGAQASFGLTEAKRGLIAGAGGCIRLARAVPRAIALEMVTTAVPISADRAYEVGLVNRVVPTDEVRAEAIRMAELIAANSPLAVRESLRLTRAATDVAEAELFALQEDVVANIVASPDVREGATAFVEKRAPNWTT